MSAEQVNYLYALCGLVALWAGWLWKIRPRWRRFSARVSGALDTLGGRDAVTDYATGQQLPAVLPLGERLGGIETALTRLADVHDKLADHDRRLQQLEGHTAERTAMRLESAALLAAAEKLTDGPPGPEYIDAEQDPDDPETP